MKTAEELKALKEDVEALKAKLAQLTEDELKQVTGGFAPNSHGAYIMTSCIKCGNCLSSCKECCIKFDGTDYFVDTGNCTMCGACQSVCPNDSIIMI